MMNIFCLYSSLYLLPFPEFVNSVTSYQIFYLLSILTFLTKFLLYFQSNYFIHKSYNAIPLARLFYSF